MGLRPLYMFNTFSAQLGPTLDVRIVGSCAEKINNCYCSACKQVKVVMVVVPFDFINSLRLLEHVLKAGHMNLKGVVNC